VETVKQTEMSLFKKVITQESLLQLFIKKVSVRERVNK
jgi:hypothetical protein